MIFGHKSFVKQQSKNTKLFFYIICEYISLQEIFFFVELSILKSKKWDL